MSPAQHAKRGFMSTSRLERAQDSADAEPLDADRQVGTCAIACFLLLDFSFGEGLLSV